MNKPIRILIWGYFFTLMIEGVLRKWIVPGLSNELLLIREPIVLAAYALAFADARFPYERPVWIGMVVGVLAVVFSGIFLGIPYAIILFGFKASFLHLPMIYLIPRYFNREDVIHMGQWVLLFLVPNAVLMLLQFGVSPDHWLNATPGGGTGQMEGAMGRIRPPGLFSFITGSAQFIALASAVLVFGFINRGFYTRRALYLCALLLVLSVAVSISRLALGSVLLVAAAALFIAWTSRNRSIRVLTRLALPCVIIGLLATRFEVFHEGQEAFESRLMRTGDLQAGVGGTALNWYQRTLNDFTGGLYLLDGFKIRGEGLGMGTNVAARYITGRQQFLLAEGEWARIILEIGPVLGLALIGVRIAIVWLMLRLSLQALKRANHLPILLFASCFLLVLTGQWGQGTSLGFSILGAGLTLAATRQPKPRTS